MGQWFGDLSVSFQNSIVRKEYNVPRAAWGVIVILFYVWTKFSEHDLLQIPYQTLLDLRNYLLLFVLVTVLFFGDRFMTWNIRETRLNRAIVVALFGLELGIMFGLLVSFLFIEDADEFDWIIQASFTAVIILDMFDIIDRKRNSPDWTHRPLNTEEMHQTLAWILAIISWGVFFSAYNPWMNAGGVMSSMSVARDSDMMIPTLAICLLTCTLPLYMGILYKELGVRLAYFAMFFAFLFVSFSVMIQYL